MKKSLYIKVFNLLFGIKLITLTSFVWSMQNDMEYSKTSIHNEEQSIILESTNKTGVLVRYISNYAKLPFKKNDMILVVNKKKVKTVEDFYDKLRKIKDGQVAIIIERGGDKKQILVQNNSIKDILVPKPPKPPKPPAVPIFNK